MGPIEGDEEFFEPEEKEILEDYDSDQDEIIEENLRLEQNLIGKIKVDPRLHEQTIQYSTNYTGIQNDILNKFMDKDKGIEIEKDNAIIVEL